jgi:hypothetical protein
MFTHHLIRRSLLGGLVVVAAGFPTAAQARPIKFSPASSSPPQVVVSPSGAQQRSGAQSSFQWSDAGIGAAGTILLLGAGASAAGTMRRRRTRPAG